MEVDRARGDIQGRHRWGGVENYKKSFVLSEEDAEFWNFWRKRIKGHFLPGNYYCIHFMVFVVLPGK